MKSYKPSLSFCVTCFFFFLFMNLWGPPCTMVKVAEKTNVCRFFFCFSFLPIERAISNTILIHILSFNLLLSKPAFYIKRSSRKSDKQFLSETKSIRTCRDWNRI